LKENELKEEDADARWREYILLVCLVLYCAIASSVGMW
jgi:hypothetical protein